MPSAGAKLALDAAHASSSSWPTRSPGGSWFRPAASETPSIASPTANALERQVDAAGLASGLINTATQVGAAIGLAVLATIATSRTDHLLRAAHGADTALPGALTDGFSRAFFVGAGFAVIGVVLALLFVRDGRPAAGHEGQRRRRGGPGADRGLRGWRWLTASAITGIWR